MNHLGTRTALHAELDMLIAAWIDYRQRVLGTLYPDDFPSVMFPHVFELCKILSDMEKAP